MFLRLHNFDPIHYSYRQFLLSNDIMLIKHMSFTNNQYKRYKINRDVESHYIPTLGLGRVLSCLPLLLELNSNKLVNMFLSNFIKITQNVTDVFRVTFARVRKIIICDIWGLGQ